MKIKNSQWQSLSLGLVLFTAVGCSPDFNIQKSNAQKSSPIPEVQKKEPVSVTVALPADPALKPPTANAQTPDAISPSDIQVSGPAADVAVHEPKKPAATTESSTPETQNCVDRIQPEATPEPVPDDAGIGTSICEVKVDGIVQKTVFARNRNECYSMIAFGALNCDTYARFIPNDGQKHFLDQVFDGTDRVSSEYCISKTVDVLCSPTGKEDPQNIERPITPVVNSNQPAAEMPNSAVDTLRVVARSIEQDSILSAATDRLTLTLNKNVNLNTFSIRAACFDANGAWLYIPEPPAWKPEWKKQQASVSENLIHLDLFKLQYLPNSNNCQIEWSIATDQGSLSETIRFKNQQEFAIQGSGQSSEHFPYYFMGGSDSINLLVPENAASADKTKISLSCEGNSIPLSGGWFYDRSLSFYLETPNYLPLGNCSITAAEGAFVSKTGAKSPAKVISMPVVQQKFYVEMFSEGHGGGGTGTYLTGVNRIDALVPPSEVFMLFFAKIPVGLLASDLTMDCGGGTSVSIERITDSGQVRIFTLDKPLPHGHLCKVRMAEGKFLTDILGDKDGSFEVNLTVDGNTAGTKLNRSFSFPYNPEHSSLLVYQANRSISGQLEPSNYSISCTSGTAPKVVSILPEYSFKGSAGIQLNKVLEPGQSCTAVVKNQKAWDGSPLEDLSVEFSRPSLRQ